MLWRCVSAILWLLVWGVPAARADLEFTADSTSEGFRFVIVSGTFAFSDDLDRFARLVRTHNPAAVSFNSPGGNVAKAMELGRLIRSYRLNTLQFRGIECSSACSLAFMGGTMRYAEAGSIGVHKSSFSDGHGFSAEEAVSHVQAITADVMMFMGEMGVDPALLQLSLQYDSDDMRYLSRSEMEKFRVVTVGDASPPNPPSSPKPLPPIASPTPQADTYAQDDRLSIPVARSGRVRHPKGSAPVKMEAEGKSATVATLRNGTPLSIIDNQARWYRIRTGGTAGFMHHTWVYVDQFESGPFERRHIQIKSLEDMQEAIRFAQSSPIDLDVYLASNSWFAVTLRGTFDEVNAKAVLKSLKSRHQIPDDSFMTYANTYVKKVCCN